MSVPKGKRNEEKDPVRYVETTFQLFEHTLRYTKKKFNNEDKDLARTLRDLASSAFVNVVAANSIFPKTTWDIEERRRLLTQAKAHIAALSAYITVVKRNLQTQITEYGYLHWGELIDTAEKTIANVITSDTKREIKNPE